MFDVVEAFQKQQPRGLLGVVELGGAAGLFPENIVDIFKCLFEHGVLLLLDMEAQSTTL